MLTKVGLDLWNVRSAGPEPHHRRGLREPLPQNARSSAVRCKKVNWYEPLQLLRTAQKVAISTILGEHSDHRLIEALTDSGTTPEGSRLTPQGAHDYHEEHCPFWFDYVSDTGDGWDATYTVAYHLAQPYLTLNSESEPQETRRGQVLVFGGDEVYPTPSSQEYHERLVGPYRAALPPLRGMQSLDSEFGTSHLDALPHCFALPGNHDWYDSLVSFSRLFCSRQSFAGWVTPQSRSYFALKLPKGWWLVGSDIQLASDIDAQQAEFFKKVAREMGEGDRIIWCVAEPHWIYKQIYGLERVEETNLAALQKLLEKRIAVYVAGDLHHYRRHSDGVVHKITAGGGGAFLHLTNGPSVDVLDDGLFRLEAEYPTRETSNRICRRNLMFPFLNPRFGLITSCLYTIAAWSFSVDTTASHSVSEAFRDSLRSSLNDPFAMFLLVVLFTGVLVFTDTHSKAYRWLAGLSHASAHLAAVFIIGWLVTRLTNDYWGLGSGSIRQRLVSAALLLVAGYVIGPTLMGIYLFVSVRIFRRHLDDASASLSEENYKNFLRFKIDNDGSLTIYPVGIDKVGRGTCSPGSSSQTDSWFVPAETSMPKLIESAPIRLA